MHHDEDEINEGSSVEEEQKETLETLLSKVGLQDKVNVFQQEQIDVESLVSGVASFHAFNLQLCGL